MPKKRNRRNAKSTATRHQPGSLAAARQQASRNAGPAHTRSDAERAHRREGEGVLQRSTSPLAAVVGAEPSPKSVGTAAAPCLSSDLPVGVDYDAEPLRDWPYPLPDLPAQREVLVPQGWVDRRPALAEDPMGLSDPGLETCTATRRKMLDWTAEGLSAVDAWDDPVGAVRCMHTAPRIGRMTTVARSAADAALAVILTVVDETSRTGYHIFHLRPDDPAATPGIGCTCLHDGCDQAYEEWRIIGPYLTSFEAAKAAPGVSAVEVPWLSAQAVLDLNLRHLGW